MEEMGVLFWNEIYNFDANPTSVCVLKKVIVVMSLRATPTAHQLTTKRGDHPFVACTKTMLLAHFRQLLRPNPLLAKVGFFFFFF